jgi:DNA mismatch repair protein MutS
MGPGHEIAIITGPNMAGKSTYIRQAALLILMAQIGSFIPAEKATIGVVDRIFTRIGSADEIARGRSTFMVEMVETANILNNATEKSFIALDEIGRGTSTFDGISLAWAIMEYIRNKIQARTLFATHYHEMADLSEVYPNIHNYNVAVQECGEEIIFLYKIVPGSADKSYGIHVARIAGIPKEVIKQGRVILGNLETHALDLRNYTRQCCRSSESKGKKVADNLFTLVGEGIIDTLTHLDIQNLTPLEALDILKELQNEARQI